MLNNTIRISLSGNPTTLDVQKTPATITAQVSRNIYDTLIDSDLSPLLAQSWTVSKDATTWTFTLRENVYFHDGSLLTADDVVASIKRIQDPSTSSPFVKDTYLIKEIKASDTYTVTILLTIPYPPFLYLLADTKFSILSKKHIEQKHDFDREPIGTGPFAFISWVDNSVISLKKNNNYYLPVLPEYVDFIIIPDAPAQVQAILRGELDILPYVINPELSQLRITPHIKVLEQPNSTILVLAMNLQKAPFNNLSFRKALTESIDKEAVLSTAYGGGKVTNTFWHSASPFYISIPSIYNPQAAKRYFSKNPPSRELTITIPQMYEPHVRAGQLYQQMLLKVGVKTKIERVDWATWLSRVYKKREFDMTIIGHTGKLFPSQRLNAYGNGENYIGWSDPLFRELIEKAEKETNTQAQILLYQEALYRMSNDFAFIFIGESTIDIAYNARIKNLIVDPVLETYKLKDIIITNNEAP